jgi:hypothetical protein
LLSQNRKRASATGTISDALYTSRSAVSPKGIDVIGAGLEAGLEAIRAS